MKNTLLILSASLIVSCGGSSGGDDEQNTPPTNQNPTVLLSERIEVDEQSLVSIEAEASDSDGLVDSFAWSQAAGTEVSIADASNATLQFNAPGVLENTHLSFQVVVTDDDGGQTIANIDVIVVANIPPQLEVADDFAVMEQRDAEISALAEDIDGSIVSYSWEQLSGVEVDLQGTDTAVVRFIAPDVVTTETLEFRLTVTDDDGDSSTDAVSVTINPNIFPVTLSSNVNECGTAVPADVDFTFVDEEGTETLYTITHSGVEQTYTFEEEFDGVKTIKIEKYGTDYVLVDIDPETPLYFEMVSESVSSCGCPMYDISVENEPELSDFVRLWVDGNLYFPTLTGGNRWDNIEICDHQENSVFIVDSDQEKFSHVSISDNPLIAVDGLTSMSLSILDGDLSGFSTPTPIAQTVGFYPDGEGFLEFAYFHDDSDISNGMMPFIDNENIADYRFQARFPVDYLNVDLQANPSFTASEYEDVIFTSEWHTVEASTTTISDAFSYDAFEFESIEVELQADQMIVSSANTLSIDAAYLIFTSGGEDGFFTEVYLPVADGVLDYSKIQNAISGLTGTFIVLLVDYIGLEGYDSAVATNLRKRVTGQSVQYRALSFIVF